MGLAGRLTADIVVGLHVRPRVDFVDCGRKKDDKKRTGLSSTSMLAQDAPSSSLKGEKFRSERTNLIVSTNVSRSVAEPHPRQRQHTRGGVSPVPDHAPISSSKYFGSIAGCACGSAEAMCCKTSKKGVSAGVSG